jgi:predicted Rossmann fold nucleotide-binding protein DprA/Smf involved in DNA uptake
MGRDVFAIPGSIHAPLARGCHRTIKQGAKLVETPEDVLEELGIIAPAPPGPAVEISHSHVNAAFRSPEATRRPRPFTRHA